MQHERTLLSLAAMFGDFGGLVEVTLILPNFLIVILHAPQRTGKACLLYRGEDIHVSQVTRPTLMRREIKQDEMGRRITQADRRFFTWHESASQRPVRRYAFLSDRLPGRPLAAMTLVKGQKLSINYG